MDARQSLIDELEAAVQSGSEEKRRVTLRRVTDLFLANADQFDDLQIALFDNVLGHLIELIEAKALAELSSRLAPVKNAPAGVIRRLAQNDEIAIAGPVLAQSARLTARDLVEIAATKSQGHLVAISGRRELEEAVTDALLDFGNRDVRHTLARNDGARLSETGFGTLVKNAETDNGLAESLGLRLDIPVRLLRQLLSKATVTVRSRLLASAAPGTRTEIARVLGTLSDGVGAKVTMPPDFTRAIAAVALMKEQGRLDEETLLAFVTERKYEEMVAALSALCSTPIEFIAPLVDGARHEGLLVAAKAAGLKWTTVEAILRSQAPGQAKLDRDFAEARRGYVRLSKSTAHRTLRFWQVRQSAAKDEPETLGMART